MRRTGSARRMRRRGRPFGAHRPGLARLRDLGVELVHCKGAYYDWARTLADAVTFEAANPRLASPPGFSL